ncbi:hypothetical protein E1B28_007012 [Marasmius oreades]|uniref:Uncharacterized protein n=1 Tax=Marasmius oreades TaxID=181124 RepID=A0A9P7UT02_9AGAR|nr:uncharacterized protein E1B28_007012 [Marasmius oreades]KAG7093332.1 hypothetical protein E1B28_007012 [Marasmius oreades]
MHRDLFESYRLSTCTPARGVQTVQQQNTHADGRATWLHGLAMSGGILQTATRYGRSPTLGIVADSISFPLPWCGMLKADRMYLEPHHTNLDSPTTEPHYTRSSYDHRGSMSGSCRSSDKRETTC